MDTLRLLITDNNLLLSEKGNLLLEKTFETDEECVSFLTPVLKNKKKSHIDCFFSGNRLVSQSRSISYSDKDTLIADDKAMKGLVEAASHAFLKDHSGEDLEIIQTEILGISLNGYRVKSLGKQKVSNISLSIFFAAMPASFKKRLKGDITFRSFTWHAAERIRKMAKQEEFIMCSVYERSTDLSIRKSDGFFEQLSLPLGTHHIEGKEELFQKSLEEVIGKALIQLSEGVCLPGRVYLLVAPTFQEVFENAFKSESYHSMCFSENGFEVTNMSSILNA